MQQQRAEGGGILGTLPSGERKLQGKTFYLDNVKKRSMDLLVEAISLLGGRIESFLHKDVNFVVTGSPEGLEEQRCVHDTKSASDGTNGEPDRPARQRENALSGSDRRRPGTPRPVGCSSRGKALLEKAIRNNRFQGSSVLASARSWGVKSLFVDDVLLYLQQLTRESFSAKHKKSERNYSKHSACVVKAASLRSPYLKVEDASRKYKPLHMQSVTFPSLFYSGCFSPFEPPPPPPRSERLKEEADNKARETTKTPSSIQETAETPVGCNPSPWRPRRKARGYCECCRQPFSNQEEHLESEEHRVFVLNSLNYMVLDQLVADIQPGFILSPPQQSKAPLNSLPIIPPIHHPSPPELEPLSDTETEHAILALLHQGSSFNAKVPSLFIQPLSTCTATAPPDVGSPILNPASAPPDVQAFTPNVESQPLSPSLAVSLPDAPPLTDCSAVQHPDTEGLAPCHETTLQTPDPNSLPPVLSPQVLDLYDLEPHSPYSEPPFLYPEIPLQCLSHDDIDPTTTETNSVEIMSQTDREFNPKHRQHANNSLEFTSPAPQRSRSLPRQQTTITPNPRKRCRSASPEHKPNKRRRMSSLFGNSACHVKHQFKSIVRPESTITPTHGSSLLFNEMACRVSMWNPVDCTSHVEQVHRSVKSTIHDFKVPCAFTMERPGTQQNHTPFLVPKGHIWPQLSNQITCMFPCVGSTTVAEQLSCPVSSNTRTDDLLLNNISHCTKNSQDFHPSLSQSFSSVCIESALVPDVVTLSSSSSESDWDCELLSRLGPSQRALFPSTQGGCELDQDLLQRPCTWMHGTSYESHLHSVLQPSTPAPSLCGEEMDSAVFSRTVVQIVEVQH